LKHSQQKLGTSHTVGSIKKLPDIQRKEIVSQLVSSIELPREAMTIEELKSIKNGNISLGAHTLSHPFLVNCSNEDSQKEIFSSKEKLENWLGTKVDTFAYPFGSFGEREIEFVKSAGFKMAFSTVADYITKDNISSLYKLPRFEVIEHATFRENLCRMTGVWDETMSKIKSRK
jgi:peptidoglycan/xylan/chitin deacetylase (PgdA/CDA1 family)